MKKEFTLIKTDYKKSSKVRKVLIVVFFIYIAFGIIYSLINESFLKFILTTIPAITIVVGVPNLVRKYEKTGRIRLNDSTISIEINGELITYEVKNILNIDFYYRSSFGDMSTLGVLLGNIDNEFSNGAKNYIKIRSLESETLIEFLSKDSIDLIHLRNIVKIYTKMGINANLVEKEYEKK